MTNDSKHTTHHDDCGCKSAKYEQRIIELENLCRKLVEVVEDFMPNIGKCVLQDYGRLNDALILSTRLIGKPKPKGK